MFSPINQLSLCEGVSHYLQIKNSSYLMPEYKWISEFAKILEKFNFLSHLYQTGKTSLSKTGRF